MNGQELQQLRWRTRGNKNSILYRPYIIQNIVILSDSRSAIAGITNYNNRETNTIEEKEDYSKQ